MAMQTVWVLGDQLNRRIASLDGATPADTRILFVRSEAKVASKRWHRQRLHLVLTGMRRFAAELRSEGFEVDERTAPSLAAGLADHVAEFGSTGVRVMEPMSWDGDVLLRRLDVEVVPSNQFLCDRRDFASWAAPRRRLVMEDFYREQRRRLGYLMDGDEPAGGRWNLDAENREPPPSDGRIWTEPPHHRLDAVDRSVLDSLPASAFGAEPDGTWATSRSQATARLRHFIDVVLPAFGPHEDAMLSDEWRLAHSALSHALNVGLLLPGEVCDAAEDAYRSGHVELASAEGFIRQVIGWREYVWGVYWLWMPEYRDVNALDAHRPLPPVFTGDSGTRMRCVSTAVSGIETRAWVHHIQRLMVLGNLALLAGISPSEMVDWMWRSFIDGAEWVMLPNLLGMSLHADGGRMATKPYAAGGAYINRMSDYCRECDYNPKKRVGDDACPFTTLYWDFLDRNRSRLGGNHRMTMPLRNLDRMSDLSAVRTRAARVLEQLDSGDL